MAQGAAPAGRSCPDCAQLNRPHKPFRIHGNTYYVGTDGLSSILITSDYGHILLDGGLAESAPLIKANIEELGFRFADVRTILVSSAHHERAGGIAELQRHGGAAVHALRANESALRTGRLAANDPQFSGEAPVISPVPHVWILQDDQQVAQDSSRVRVIATPGASPGSTSWGWESCEEGTCLALVHVDSLVPQSVGRYRFKDQPRALQDFENTFRRLESVRCDVLLTARPAASQLFQRLDPQSGSRPASIKDDTACARHAGAAREALARHLASEG